MSMQTSEETVYRRSVGRANTRTEKVALEKKDDSDYSNWFSFMVSYPLRKNMSKVDILTQWSALVLYLPGAILAMCIPAALAKPFNISSRYSDGITRVVGMQLTVIAFLYWVFSRAKPRISSDCIALGTTFERIFYVGSSLYAIHRLRLVPGLLLMNVGVLDSTLSVITIYIWFSTTETASVKNYFGSILQLMSFSSKWNYSSHAVQFLGLVKLVASTAFLVYPAAANQVFQLNELHLQDRGLILLTMLGCGAIGSIHFTSGGADSRAFNIAVVFYCVCFSMPFVAVLSALDQIPLTLATYLLCMDGIGVTAISLTLCMD